MRFWEEQIGNDDEMWKLQEMQDYYEAICKIEEPIQEEYNERIHTIISEDNNMEALTPFEREDEERWREEQQTE